jgi:hypothetical protein
MPSTRTCAAISRNSSGEVISWLSKNGVKNTRPLNPGGTYSSDFGRAKCVNAIHSSSLPDGTYGGSAGRLAQKQSRCRSRHAIFGQYQENNQKIERQPDAIA